MNNEPTITELPKMIEEYEKRHGTYFINLELFSNGEGSIKHWRESYEVEMFEFKSISELINKLNQ